MNKKTAASYLLSAFSIGTILVVNYRMAHAYNKADSKTKALFGMIEISFSNQYYLVLPIALALFLGIGAYANGSQKTPAVAAIFIACAALMLLFARVWRGMV